MDSEAGQSGLRTFLEGLRIKGGVAGVALNAALKVVGQDPLPLGASFGTHVVTLTAGTLDGWDLGGRGLVIRGRVSVANVRSEWRPGVSPLYPVEIALGGDLEWAEHLDLSGPFGKSGRPGAVVNARSSGTGANYRTGILRMLRQSRFVGFPGDHLKLHGVAGGVQVVEENYFGPQWAPYGSAAHADAITTVAAQGKVHIRRNLFDWTDQGRPAGLTNVFRICRNTGTTTPIEHVRIEENLALYGPARSYPVQVAAGVGGITGPVEVVNNWFRQRVTNKGTRVCFHPSTSGQVALWSGNRDADTGADIPAPSGARAG